MCAVPGVDRTPERVPEVAPDRRPDGSDASGSVTLELPSLLRRREEVAADLDPLVPVALDRERDVPVVVVAGVLVDAAADLRWICDEM